MYSLLAFLSATVTARQGHAEVSCLNGYGKEDGGWTFTCYNGTKWYKGKEHWVTRSEATTDKQCKDECDRVGSACTGFTMSETWNGVNEKHSNRECRLSLCNRGSWTSGDAPKYETEGETGPMKNKLLEDDWHPAFWRIPMCIGEDGRTIDNCEWDFLRREAMDHDSSSYETYMSSATTPSDCAKLCDDNASCVGIAFGNHRSRSNIPSNRKYQRCYLYMTTSSDRTVMTKMTTKFDRNYDTYYKKSRVYPCTDVWCLDSSSHPCPYKPSPPEVIELHENEMWFYGTNWHQFPECDGNSCIDNQVADYQVANIDECVKTCTNESDCLLSLYREDQSTGISTCRIGITAWGKEREVNTVPAETYPGSYEVSNSVSYTAIRNNMVERRENQMWFFGTNWNYFPECIGDDRCKSYTGPITDIPVKDIDECIKMCTDKSDCRLTLYQEDQLAGINTCRIGITAWGKEYLVDSVKAETDLRFYEVQAYVDYTAIRVNKVEVIEDKLWFWGTNWNEYPECRGGECECHGDIKDLEVEHIDECIQLCYDDASCLLTLYMQNSSSGTNTCRIGITAWGSASAVKAEPAVSSPGYYEPFRGVSYTAIRLHNKY